MKKLFALVFATVAFTACGNKMSNADSSAVDSVNVDSVNVVDTLTTDSTVCPD